MKTGMSLHAAGGVVAAMVCCGAQGQILHPGDMQFRIIADKTVVSGPDDAVVHLALQARHVGTDVRIASFGSSHGRIVSQESDDAGILERTGVRDGPFGRLDYGFAQWKGMTGGLRDFLFEGPFPSNNANPNGGDPNTPTFFNPFNGGGEFRWTSGLAGFSMILPCSLGDDAGRVEDEDGVFISVGLIDDDNGNGDGTGIEPTDGIVGDEARWDTLFMFTYTVTDFTARTISFDYQNIGSAAFPGTSEDTMRWWNDVSQHFSTTPPAVGVYRDDLSDNIVVAAAPSVDWNGDGVVNSTDVSDFINDWFTDQVNGTLVTDFNNDGVSNSTDVSDFINAWFEAQ